MWHEQGKSAKQTPAPARIEYWRSRYRYFAKHHSASTGSLLRLGLAVKLMVNELSSGLLTGDMGKNAKWRGRWQVNPRWAHGIRPGCPPAGGLSQ